MMNDIRVQREIDRIASEHDISEDLLNEVAENAYEQWRPIDDYEELVADIITALQNEEYVYTHIFT